MKKITTPISDDEIASLKVGDQILISGTMYTGRDAILPKLAELANEKKSPVDLKGMAIMHTAVSDAGIAPTTSNKEEIESTIPDTMKMQIVAILIKQLKEYIINYK